MKHDIIKTDNYLLVVDESEITKGNWHLANDIMITKSHLIDENCKKIIAHLPLNGSPILEGVDFLPPLEVDNSLGTPLVQYIFEKHNQDRVMGFCDGYNKAKEKYKYTEEDMRKAIDYCKYNRAFEYDFETIIQSLSQPKMPIGFEFEAAKSKPIFNGEPKTLSNVVGFTQWTWEGTYIFN